MCGVLSFCKPQPFLLKIERDDDGLSKRSFERRSGYLSPCFQIIQQFAMRNASIKMIPTNRECSLTGAQAPFEKSLRYQYRTFFFGVGFAKHFMFGQPTFSGLKVSRAQYFAFACNACGLQPFWGACPLKILPSAKN